MRGARWLSLITIAAAPRAAWAGMPSVTLTDLGRLRLENISFFLAGFLLAALFIKLIWNFLAKDWTFLPRLGYLKALGLTTLWGLLFILVLTMISGARELMTPAAWEKQGATYKLKSDAPELPTEAQRDELRRNQLERLRGALWAYALAHQGQFPDSRTDPGVPADLWKLPDPSGLQYVYRGGRLSREQKAVAFEPELYPGGRLALLANGTVRRLSEEELTKLLEADAK